jgi:hypothetical protein
MSRLVTPDNMRGGGGRGNLSQPQGMQIIDVGREPSLKTALLQGRIQNLAAPFMYHDPAKQFCFVLMPMELNMGQVEQQRIIGQMTQSLMRGLPEDAPRGYLLTPKTFFTFQSLVEAILEGDGVTPEMLKEQQAKVELLRSLVRITDEAELRATARENDAKIDGTLFELLSATMEANLQAGRDQIAQQLSDIQKILVEETTYGAKVGARLKLLETFQKNPTREVLLEQLLVAEDAESREMLITIGRQALDYGFFQALTAKVDGATDAAAKDKLVALRKEVQDVRDRVDAAGRAYMQEKTNLIQAIATSKDPLQTARDNADLIDDAFLQVLQMNAQTAQQRGDEKTMQAFAAIQEIALQVMAERQPPEVQIIQALMSAAYPEETEKLLHEVKEIADDRLIQVMIQYADQLAQNDRTDMAAKMTQIMVQARAILPKYDPSNDPDAQPPSGGAPPPPPPSSGPAGGGLITDLRGGSAPPPPPAGGSGDAPRKPLIEIARR